MITNSAVIFIVILVSYYLYIYSINRIIFVL